MNDNTETKIGKIKQHIISHFGLVIFTFGKNKNPTKMSSLTLDSNFLDCKNVNQNFV